MKKIQCTGCGQVFWADLQLDETLVFSGEWIQNSCPKCQTKWAVVVETTTGVMGKRGRKARPGPKRRGRPKKRVQGTTAIAPVKEKEGAAGFSPVSIRRLRKKLRVSQSKFASLVGVSTGTIVGWESGKFKPRGNKAAELSDLEKWDTKEISHRLAEKETKPAESKSRKTLVRKAAKPQSRKEDKPVEEEPPEPAASEEAAEELKREEGENNRGGRGRRSKPKRERPVKQVNPMAQKIRKAA